MVRSSPAGTRPNDGRVLEGRPRRGRFYNLGHWLFWPALLLAFGIPAGRSALIGAGSIWLAHIGMDRALGYGLKLEEGFTHTHLGMIDRKA